MTGGLGFVGVHLVKDLQDKFNCFVLDNEFIGKHRRTLLEEDRFKFIHCDISKEEEVKKVFEDENFDVVIHLAAKHLIPWCNRNNAEAYNTNVVGTLNILNQINFDTKFIFVSSAAVYGASELALTEDNSTLFPFDIYGLTKLHGEAITKLKAKERKIDYTIIRLFNVIGPYESNGHILPEICFQLRNGSKKLLLGNTTSFRDFIGVKDVSVGIAKIIDIPQTQQTVNLCSGLSYSMDNIIDEVKKISGIDFMIERDPSRQRKSDNPFIKGSIAKLQKLTQWQPKTNLSENVKSVWEDKWTPENWQYVVK